MSDESDETRRFSPDDDASGRPERTDKPAPGASDPDAAQDATPVSPDPGAAQDATPVSPDPDAAQDATPVSPDPDATQVGGFAPDVDAAGATPDPGATQVEGVPAVGDDDTVADGRQVPPVGDEPTVVQDRLGSTAVMPPVDDDWAPSRGNPAWSGRAEVRPPQPVGGRPEADWTAAVPPQRDRWWMPIVVGIIALILLGVLGWAIWLIVRDSDDETPAPVATTSATSGETATTQASSPSPTPTTTSASPSPTLSSSTASPAASEVQIPALRGLSLPEAQVALRSTGLNYRLIYRPASDVPPGTVIDSDPVEGQEVPPDTTVTLVIAAEATNTPTEPTQGP